jgi:hypothetical protein
MRRSEAGRLDGYSTPGNRAIRELVVSSDVVSNDPDLKLQHCRPLAVSHRQGVLPRQAPRSGPAKPARTPATRLLQGTSDAEVAPDPIFFQRVGAKPGEEDLGAPRSIARLIPGAFR